LANLHLYLVVNASYAFALVKGMFLESLQEVSWVHLLVVVLVVVMLIFLIATAQA
jgi:hypothetical protein